jgi:chromate transporter
VPNPLPELAATFLRLGFTAFGGPAAHIAMMRQEFVDRRRWLTDEEYADMVGAANLVPGPSSTEVAIHIGYRRAGVVGLVLAGICFILPAALLVGVIAAVYKSYGSLPQAQHAMYGIKPVVIAIILHALWVLGKKVLRSPLTIAVGLLSAIGGYFAVMPLILLFGGGMVTGAPIALKERSAKALKPLAVLLASVAAVATLPWAMSFIPRSTTESDPASLFVVFLKIGSVLYGSGYVLLAFLKTEIVGRAWLTQSQLLDAVAVGQFTPGPVFTTATFIGYIVAGPAGAITATIGIFLPAFLFVAMSGHHLRRLRENSTTAAFLDGVNAAAIGLIVAVAIQLGRDALVDPLTIALAAGALAVLLRFKINSAWLILIAAIIGSIVKSV